MNRERLLKEMKVRRIHVYPRLLAEMPRETAARFDSPWAAVERLAAILGRMPLGALHFLLAGPTGAFAVTPAESLYARGPYTLHKTQVENVAFVSAAALLSDEVEVLRTAAYLYDHLLGSGGASGGPNLSDGVGVTPQWTEVATQIPRLFALGHNPDPLCRRSPADYFAQSAALHAVRPRELNAADPNMHKLLARSFFSENFWRQRSEES